VKRSNTACVAVQFIAARVRRTHLYCYSIWAQARRAKNELDERDSSVLRSGTDHKEMWTMDLDRKAHSFIPGLKPSFSANPSHCSLPFLYQNWLHGFPGLFADTSEHIRFLLFSFLFLHFLVVGSVRYIKPTHVGFWLHVKIASYNRIVS